MTEPATDISPRLFRICAGLILLLALALRLIAARGDLWLDEIWTLTLVKPLTGADQIFWKINHDNNHMLNSLWMYWLGPYQPTLLYRLPAVVLGTCSIAVAGLWAARRSRFAALVAMILFAVAYAMVDFGSEARGYAGFILATLVALCCIESALVARRENRDLPGVSLWLGIVMLLGTLCHLLMFVAAFALVLWAFWAEYRRENRLVATLVFVLRLFGPACLLMLPVFCEIAFAIARHHFVMGVGTPPPFDAEFLLRVFGRMLEATLGIPLVDNPWVYIAFWLAALGLRYKFGSGDDVRSLFYVAALAVVPALLLLGQVPNTSQPRFFLLSSMAAMLMFADICGEQWDTGRRRRRLPVAIAIGIVLMGNGLLLGHFLVDGRGHYSQALRWMASSGPARYYTDPKKNNPILEEYYIHMGKLPLSYEGYDGWCAAPPKFLLVYAKGHDAPETELTAGPSECPVRFNTPRLFAQWGFGGVPWVVYERE